MKKLDTAIGTLFPIDFAGGVAFLILSRSIWGIREGEKAADGKKNTFTACRACSVQCESGAKPARAVKFF